MAEYLILYAIFCLATSTTFIFTVVKPVMKTLAIEKPLCDISQHRYLALGIFFIMGLIFAPIVLLPAIVPKYNLTFSDTLYNTLEK